MKMPIAVCALILPVLVFAQADKKDQRAKEDIAAHRAMTGGFDSRSRIAGMKLFALLLVLILPLGAQAQSKFGQPPQAGVPGAEVKPLAERKDVVSWRLLAQVELIKMKDRFVPQFSADVAALDKKEVKVQGFMTPLEMGDKQSHFILSSMPPSCSFCMPGGPESLVEVKTKRPIAYGMEPVVLSGRLAVLKDDPTGVFYRLTDAVPAK